MSRSAKGFVPRADRIDINREFASVEAFINEYVSNISRSGVFIKSKDPLAVGTKVNLRFTVLMDEIETLEGVGEVVRVSERPRGMGVVFIVLTEHSQGLLGKLLTRREAQKAVAAGVAAAEHSAAHKAAARAAARAAAAAGPLEDVLAPASKVTTSMKAVRPDAGSVPPPATGGTGARSRPQPPPLPPPLPPPPAGPARGGTGTRGRTPPPPPPPRRAR